MTQAVEAIWLRESGPRMLRGNLSVTKQELRLVITSDDLPTVGSRLILYGTDIQMLSTRVTQAFEHNLVLEEENRPSDKRLHPRLFGNIPTRLVPLGTHDANAWLEGSIEIEEGWLKPEPFMNFSVNGLSFDLTTPLVKGSLCLVEFSVGDNSQKHRAQATVIRSIPNANTTEIALHFSTLPSEAKRQLSEFTLSIQEALLHK